MRSADPLDSLQEAAALWSIGAVSSEAVVACACDALIAGADSPWLRILAGLTRGEASYDVPLILPAALGELGLDFYSRGSDEGREAVARALAAQAVAGRLTPRQLVAEIHRHFGHGLLLAERLAFLDDEYDWGEYAERTRGQIDKEVMVIARVLAQHWRTANDAE